jgi:hypothetical protein
MYSTGKVKCISIRNNIFSDRDPILHGNPAVPVQSPLSFMQLQISVSLNFSKFRSLIVSLATDSELFAVVLTLVNKSLFIVSISVIPIRLNC